jgi:hypothetical protein
MTESTAAGPLIDHPVFDGISCGQLPEIWTQLDEDHRALLHLEMAEVARATCRAIEIGDRTTEDRHFKLMDSVFARAAPDVENAIYVSWLENVFLGDERREFLEARTRLPEGLAKGLRELEDHFARLGRAPAAAGRWHHEQHKGGEVRVLVTPTGGLIEPITPETRYRFWAHVVIEGEQAPERGGPNRYVPGGADGSFDSPEAALEAGIAGGRALLDRLRA